MLTSPNFLACTGSQTEDLKFIASISTADHVVRILARIRAGRHRNLGLVPSREKRFVTFLQRLDQQLRRTLLRQYTEWGVKLTAHFHIPTLSSMCAYVF
jgi:hypothetical protein